MTDTGLTAAYLTTLTELPLNPLTLDSIQAAAITRKLAAGEADIGSITALADELGQVARHVNADPDALVRRLLTLAADAALWAQAIDSRGTP
jgi:hypothetical protein